jgi:hypothetical protein
MFPVAEDEPYRQPWRAAILVDMPAMPLDATAASSKSAEAECRARISPHSYYL